ncbi:MAG: undecaprenyldiphospho-muramoylpentapeptide beta-N-acetylglucosaminyltransferase [Deltaproteobacteria bacterium]|nr:undecaprenyldiphospho-muramoylpentapeptide beta-N-acetylglucosaminyltransferase [Deltaproteobacteria bacterium]
MELETRNSQLKVVIAAGGTGGHLFPGLAVAREFQARLGASVTFITSPKAVATRILESAGFPWETVASRALKGQGIFSRLGTWWHLPGSIQEAVTRLKTLQPHLVLGMGGYTAGPAGVAAWSMKLPLALHEQNALPGFTNRWLARLADRVFVSFPASLDQFPRNLAVWTGNPAREEFFRESPPRPEQPFTVLITGGSQGAHHLNMEVLAALPELKNLKDRLRFLHLTGDADREEVAAGYDRAGFAARVEAFNSEMPELMAQAHLIVCRAGASTLAELTAVGRAALLVPYPFAANNHQEFNARFLVEAGAAQLILNKDFTGSLFAGKIQQYMAEPETLARMEAAARRLAKPEAAKEIVEGCLGLIEDRSH